MRGDFGKAAPHQSAVKPLTAPPLGGSHSEQIFIIAELDIARALDREGPAFFTIGQGHVAVGVQPLQNARVIAAALLIGADQVRGALWPLSCS